jgi:hypothetical protein
MVKRTECRFLTADGVRLLTAILGSFVAAVLTVHACSWYNPIWSKSKKSDTPLYRFVIHQDKAGYIDRDGKIVIPPRYQASGNYGFDDFWSGIARVYRDGRYWYTDQTGRELMPASAKFEAVFSEGVAPAQKTVNGVT